MILDARLTVVAKRGKTSSAKLRKADKRFEYHLTLVETYKDNLKKKDDVRGNLGAAGVGLSLLSLGIGTVPFFAVWAATSSTLHFTHRTPDLDKLIEEYKDLKKRGYGI